MGGNVAEWVADWYAPYEPSKDEDPIQDEQPAKDPLRVLRGGAWTDAKPRDVRAADRRRSTERLRTADAGFRCAQGRDP
jgi:formylglycine-generating enzyme required for sulfatase activity